MISIRWRLTILLCLVVGGLFVATGLGVFVAMRQLLWSQFDETLTAKARALITASEIDDGEFEIDLTIQDFAGFGHGGDDYFEIRRMGGDLFLRSPSLETDNPDSWGIGHIASARNDEPRLEHGKLGDGRLARFYIQRFYPKDDEKELHKDLYLVVASPTRSMHFQLARLATVLTIAGGAALLLMVPAIRLGLGRGLRPLDQLGADIGRIKPENLHQRLDAERLPKELVPVADRLNEWIARLESSFDRERRFSSHAAHELRTPLAEMKAIAELGTMWKDEATQEHCAEMLAIAGELEALLDKLSLLARADAGSQPVVMEPVNLETSITTAVSRFEGIAAKRQLRIEMRAADEEFSTDPVLWATILQNLLGNAVFHAPEGSTITVEASPAHLTVSNPAPDLTGEDMERLFERFWRKDESRSDHGHSGLGLSIVRACASLLGGSCSAETDSCGQLRLNVLWSLK
jgi:signal transduction histidine kinase